MIDDEGGEVSKRRHVKKLKEGPAKGVSFFMDNDESTHALHGEHEEYDEAGAG